MDRYAVIMAGGDGTRFWPLSRQHKPKQLLSLSGNDIMINETINRVKGIIDIGNILVVTGRKQYAAMKNFIQKEFPEENLLVEPQSRNTAPCIGYAAMEISSRSRDGIMCVLPSDHFISNEAGFKETLIEAFEAAEKTGKLITIGIRPTAPSTGYGYIRFDPEEFMEFKHIHEVLSFVEKPDLNRARGFLESGEYLWNSGIFVWKVSVILSNIERYLPRLYMAMIKIIESIEDQDKFQAIEHAYSQISPISIDYGILERSDDVLVIPGDFGWNDIGSWNALDRLIPPDDKENVVKAKHIGRNTSKSIIFGSDRLIATIGLENIIIADTSDALLVCSRDRTEEVKKLVEEIKLKGLEEYL